LKVFAVVPARSGSKGFKNKNIARIGGLSLLELAINVGLGCNEIDSVYVSTDSKKYENIAKSFGAISLGLRPSILSNDRAKTIDVIIDLINKIKKDYDYLVLLQPSSPVREPRDIKKMFNILLSENADAIVSVVQIDEPHPHKLKIVDGRGFIAPFLENTTSEIPRQELPSALALNGAVYIVRVKKMLEQKTFLPKKTLPFLMKKNLNIDSEEDFEYLKYLVDNKKVKLFLKKN